MARAGTVTLSLDEIQIGSCARHPIQDETGRLLVDAATPVTRELLLELRERGIEGFEVDEFDAAMLRGETTHACLTEKARSFENEQPSCDRWESFVKGDLCADTPLKSLLVDRHDEGINRQRSQRLHQALNHARGALEALNPRKSGFNEAAVAACGDVSDAYARAIIDDRDQTVGSVTPSSPGTDLADRSIQMSVIAMAVGIELGLDGPQAIELGTAGLLHDIGLTLMDPRFLNPAEPLTQADLWEYQKHPLIALEYLQRVAELPQAVELGIQQTHEQFDGSGYPRGMSSRRIHINARILNVVDSYLQLTRPMLGRDAVVPHDAIGMLLHRATQGVFDPKVVRAFLTTETLFPLGSCVELDRGEIARVIRRPRTGYALPVLQTMDGERIELESTSRKVIRPAIDPTQKQMRLTLGMMESGCDSEGVPLLSI